MPGRIQVLNKHLPGSRVSRRLQGCQGAKLGQVVGSKQNLAGVQGKLPTRSKFRFVRLRSKARLMTSKWVLAALAGVHGKSGFRLATSRHSSTCRCPRQVRVQIGQVDDK